MSETAPPRENDSTKTRVLIHQRRAFISSFVYASDGILRTLNTQRNMKVHWISGMAVMLVGMALDLELATRASVLFCVVLVISMEVLNTALEAFVDLHIKQYARSAMVAKDAAAASVLVLALGAVVVFADVLFHRWRTVLNSGEAVFRTVVLGVPLLASLAAVLFAKARWLIIVPGVVAFALLVTLAWFSRDEVFSLCALSMLVAAYAARIRERALLAG